MVWGQDAPPRVCPGGACPRPAPRAGGPAEVEAGCGEAGRGHASRAPRGGRGRAGGGGLVARVPESPPSRRRWWAEDGGVCRVPQPYYHEVLPVQSREILVCGLRLYDFWKLSASCRIFDEFYLL